MSAPDPWHSQGHTRRIYSLYFSPVQEQLTDTKVKRRVGVVELFLQLADPQGHVALSHLVREAAHLLEGIQAPKRWPG